MTNTVGLIVAGGRSSRFGSNKAAARLGGRTLLEIAAMALRAKCGEVAANAPGGSDTAELAASLGLEILPDLPGDAAGPLAGVRVGLEWAAALGAGRLAIRPVDTPLAPPEFHDWLAAVIGDAPAAFCATEDGPQPLCSLWTTNALAPLRQALAGGRHPPVQGFLRDIGAVKVTAPEAAAFANINTPEDLRAAEAWLANRL